MHKSSIYKGNVARDFAEYALIIKTLFKSFEYSKWSSNYDEEFGFYEKDKAFNFEMFFGIWYEAWEIFETPLCITVKSRGSQDNLNDTLTKYLNESGIIGIKLVKHNLYHLILFEYDFFKNHNKKTIEILRRLTIDIKVIVKL